MTADVVGTYLGPQKSFTAPPGHFLSAGPITRAAPPLPSRRSLPLNPCPAVCRCQQLGLDARRLTSTTPQPPSSRACEPVRRFGTPTAAGYQDFGKERRRLMAGLIRRGFETLESFGRYFARFRLGFCL